MLSSFSDPFLSQALFLSNPLLFSNLSKTSSELCQSFLPRFQHPKLMKKPASNSLYRITDRPRSHFSLSLPMENQSQRKLMSYKRIMNYIVLNFFRCMVFPGKIKQLSFRSLLTSLIKNRAKIVKQSRYVTY